MNNTQTISRNKDLLESIRKLCQLFWGPTPGACGQMVTGTYQLSFEVLDSVPKSSPPDALNQLAAFLKGFDEPDALFEELEAEYVRLFVNDRGRVIAPLYESCYEDEKNPRLMGPAAIRMQKRLEAEGMAIGDDIREPPDHLAIELEYLYFLLTRSKPEENRMDEAADFASQTLIWVNRINERLAAETHCRFYPLITALLVSVLNWIAQSGQQR